MIKSGRYHLSQAFYKQNKKTAPPVVQAIRLFMFLETKA